MSVPQPVDLTIEDHILETPLFDLSGTGKVFQLNESTVILNGVFTLKFDSRKVLSFVDWNKLKQENMANQVPT
jgi:hypothetical protein